MDEKFVPYVAQTCSVSIKFPDGEGRGSCYGDLPCPLKAIAKTLGFALLKLPQPVFSSLEKQYKKIRREAPTKPQFDREQITKAANGLPVTVWEATIPINPYLDKDDAPVNGLECTCQLKFPIQVRGRTYNKESSGTVFFAKLTTP